MENTLMEWHWTDALSMVHHFPHSIADLLHHEDKQLVKAARSGFLRHDPQAAGASSGETPSLIGIEKNIDPAISRSQQNFGLLVRDYLHNLPEYSPQTEQAEALLEHWRKILLEQPQRLAEAHLDSWNSERSRQFWKERLSHYQTEAGIISDSFPHMVDDWERSAGAPLPAPTVHGIIKSKQWHDLVIRQRLHNLDLDNMGIKR